MNKAAIISSIISGVVGLAVGGGSVFLYYKKIMDNYDEELDRSQETINDLQKQLAVKSDDIKKDLLNQISAQSNTKNEYQEAVKSIESEDIPNAVLVTDDTKDDIHPFEYPAADDEGNIRFIGPDDYDDDEDYEKEKIKFYAKDGVLTQDDDILSLKEFEDVCGKKALTSFGKYGAGSNACYVRNEEFMTDYEIKRYNLSYQSYKNGLK